MRSCCVYLVCLTLTGCSLLFDASTNVPKDGGALKDGTSVPAVDGQDPIIDASGVDSAPPGDADLSSTACMMRQGAVAWWRGNGNIADSAGDHDNGTHSGDYVYVDDNEAKKAFSFPANVATMVPDLSNHFLPSGDFSIEMWVKRFDSLTSSQVVATKDACAGTCTSDNPGSRWRLQVASSAVQFIIKPSTDAGGSQSVVATVPLPDDNAFHHVVAIRNQNTIRVHLDGIAGNSMSDAEGEFQNANGTTEPLYLGSYANGSSPLVGHIHEVVYYNYALSDTDVTTLHGTACPI